MNFKRQLLKRIFEDGGNHLGSCLSVFEIIVAIYQEIKPGDHFILSKSHASKVIDILGHIPQYDERLHVYGGSLGNGLGIAAGIAIADPDHRVFVVVGDGEMNEGSCYEAINFIRHARLKNIYTIVDFNQFQAFTFDPSIMFDDDQPIIDGHNVEKIRSHFTNDGHVIVAQTIKGNGIKDIAGTLASHYVRMTPEQYAKWDAELAEDKNDLS